MEKIQDQVDLFLPAETLRWTPLDNLHITLQFVADLKVSDLAELIEKVTSGLKAFPTFQLKLEKLQFFPSSKHPKVVALETGPQELLERLAEIVADALISIHYPLAHEQFRGHLTLGRLRHPRRQSYPLGSIELPPFPNIEISEISLFESRPGQDHQIYTELARFRLGFQQ